MRKMRKMLGVIITGALIVTSLCVSGCGKEESKKVTLQLMNGEVELAKIEVNSGEKVSEDAYKKYEEQEGYEFLGWFETPTFIEASAVDFSKATFEEDKQIFGSFKAAAAEEDTRDWYIVGAGKELDETSWAGGVDDSVKEKFHFKKADDINEFTITLNLYNGDQFQIIHDWDWADQKGFGCFTEIDETQMENGGGLSGSDSTANVNVIMDGNYTITLTTDPNNAKQDTLSIVRNGDVQ